MIHFIEEYCILHYIISIYLCFYYISSTIIFRAVAKVAYLLVIYEIIPDSSKSQTWILIISDENLTAKYRILPTESLFLCLIYSNKNMLLPRLTFDLKRLFQLLFGVWLPSLNSPIEQCWPLEGLWSICLRNHVLIHQLIKSWLNTRKILMSKNSNNNRL